MLMQNWKKGKENVVNMLTGLTSRFYENPEEAGPDANNLLSLLGWADTPQEAIMSGIPGTGPMKLVTKQGQKWIKRGEKIFDNTYDLREAGYLLPEGNFLDFSGRNQGGWGGMRTFDHRDIWQAMSGRGGGTEGMYKFMKNADAIRTHFDGDTLYLNLFNKTKPTEAQIKALSQYNRDINNIAIDIMDNQGNILRSEDLRGPYKMSALRQLIGEVFSK
jgi:hypothetical protein